MMYVVVKGGAYLAKSKNPSFARHFFSNDAGFSARHRIL